MDCQQPTTTGNEIKEEGKEEKKEEVPKLSPKACTTFNEDVVRLTGEDGKESFAVVTRCWADEQNPDALLEAKRLGIDFTPLKPGYLEVLSPDGTRREILETSTTLVDRGFIRGDLVRPARPRNTPPSAQKSQSGTIISISSRVQLQRVLAPSETNENWYETSDLVAAARVNRGDHVVSGDWVGIVEEVFEMALIETSNGGLRRVCDVGSNLSVGPVSEAVQAMLMERTGGFLASFMQQDLRTILDVKQILIAVNWLCKNQLKANEGDWTRPKRYWTDLNQLKLVRATADHLRTIHDKLVPRDPSLIPSSESTAPGHQIHSVTNSLSTLTVLWQDGTTTSGPSTSFEALQTLDDETEVFPGDVGIFSPSGSTAQGKIGVVQSMDTRKRTIKLRYLEEEGEETVSGLEFDPHGAPEEQFGVRRGDWVLIANEEEGNGAKLPVVPSLGESETSAGIMPGGEELRMELSTIGLSNAQTLSDTFTAPLAQSSPASLASIDWYGEVWDLLLDGTALIRFPDGTKRPLPISRLIHLDDGLDPEAQALAAAGLLGPDGEGMEGSEGWMTDDGEGEDEEYELADGGESGEEEEEKDERIEDRPIAKKRKRSRRESRGWADEEDVVTMEGVEGGGDEPAETEDVAEVPSTTETPTEQEERKGVSMPSAELDDFADWSRFEVLEDVPKDHHYSNETVQVPSKTFMTRVRKEHGVLASSLPPNILVRAYESRLDLLRVLIIGPLGTPFQNAPFLFDLFLPPAKFPQEPPKVFFHSWAGGTRVSPNLYSEGKVCLSLLGTWSGDKTESWSAARSSILQILISIQGLIMVEDPYFTEPGFEKQMGTPEGTSASELYNERTLVLTRTFVKRACEYPPSGFEREINAYYYSGLPSTPPTPGALKGIVEQCKSLLEESEKWLAEKEGEEEGEVKPPQSSVVPSQRVLTEGAGLSLKRTLKGLEELMERGPKILETKDQ